MKQAYSRPKFPITTFRKESKQDQGHNGKGREVWALPPYEEKMTVRDVLITTGHVGIRRATVYIRIHSLGLWRKMED